MEKTYAVIKNGQPETLATQGSKRRRKKKKTQHKKLKRRPTRTPLKTGVIPGARKG